MRTVFMVVAGAIYLIFLATFLYLIAFVAALPGLPRTVDLGPVVSPGPALAIDLLLIVLFGLQHSGMARRGFKAAWTRVTPPVLERPGYVLASSLVLIVLFAGWRPIPTPVWTVTGPVGAAALWAACAIGWALVLLSTFLINHFELFGLQQVWLHIRRRDPAAPRFRTPFLYRFVRHPLYLGFVLAFWATPRMTLGHLVLAAGMTAYILLAIGLEEGDLVALFGDEYRRYRATTGMLVPGLGRRKA